MIQEPASPPVTPLPASPLPVSPLPVSPLPVSPSVALPVEDSLPLSAAAQIRYDEAAVEPPDARQTGPLEQQAEERVETPSSNWCAAMIAALAGAAPLEIPASAQAAETSYTVSLAGVALQPGERIFAFSINVTGSASQALRWTHRNWSISTVSVNAPAAEGDSALKATARLRGATLDPATSVLPEAFSHFLTIGAQAGTPRLQGELVLRNIDDLAAPARRLVLTGEQFQLHPLQ
ncbi:MAG: hypothetical protein ABWY00_06135 [Dongiaceae bacterium]